MKNDYALRNRYLEQHEDIYGENLYLSSIELVENKISTIKGGSEPTAFYHLVEDCENCIDFYPDMNFLDDNKNLNSNIVFIVESKFQEDGNQNNSLTGEAGHLFDKILSAIDLTRSDVYILNLLSSNLPKSSDSYQSSIKICNSHFKKKIQLINPNLVVALGEGIGNRILNINESIRNMDGVIHKFGNLNLMMTYHPEEILKNPILKQSAWQDFKKIRDNYLY